MASPRSHCTSLSCSLTLQYPERSEESFIDRSLRWLHFSARSDGMDTAVPVVKMNASAENTDGAECTTNKEQHELGNTTNENEATPMEEEAIVSHAESSNTAVSTTTPVPAATQKLMEEAEEMDHEEIAAEVPAEPVYSTRGRHKEEEHPPLEEEEIVKGEAMNSGAGAGGTVTGLNNSFLEALTEEERGTSTRHIPKVDGFHSLMRNEVKSDLLLARTPVATGTVASRKRTKREDDDLASGIEDEAPSKATSVTSTVTSASLTNTIDGLVLPNKAFVAPPLNADKPKEGPQTVDSCAAFNPPRPPESVGPKKKHRLIRWERRPQDVEVDLRNYRKTVERTREELRATETEKERMEVVGAHIRMHFLATLTAMKDEGLALQKEFSKVQQDCIRASDLLTSRTRSRGVSKGSHVMRDVISVLKTRGVESAPIDSIKEVMSSDMVPTKGIGGVNAGSISDWDRTTSEYPPATLATSWVLPGDTVDTPYGQGKVVSVVGPTSFDGKGRSNERTSSKKSGRSTPNGNGKKNETDPQSLAPRVCVKLPYGIGYLAPSVVQSRERPSSYTDAQLAERWRALYSTALSVSETLDVQAMDTIGIRDDDEEANVFDGDDAFMGDQADSMSEPISAKAEDDENIRFLPAGSNMLPTGNGRGEGIAGMQMELIEKVIQTGILESEGVLGRRDNPGVSGIFREWEDTREDLSKARARVLHLRNQLHRQRRIRMNNEKTYGTCRERLVRVEGLVSEMRTDLKSLKDRLDAEVTGLGIDPETSEGLLEDFFLNRDKVDFSSMATPPKRARKIVKDVVRMSPKQTRRRTVDNGHAGQEVANPREGNSNNDNYELKEGDTATMDESSSQDEPNRKRSRQEAATFD